MSNWSIALIFLVVIYLGICLFFYSYQESFLFHPRETAQDFSYEFNYPFVERWFDTPNEGRIHTLTFKAQESKGLVFYLHGNAGSLRDWGWVYADFVPHGYDLLVLDYRTYGKSTGRLSQEFMINDAVFIYDELAKEYKEENIIIYGRSIGSGVAVQLAAQKSAKTLVLESPYYSIADVAKRIAPIFPLNILLRYKFESFRFIKDLNCPTYIIHGKADQVVPFSSGKKLAEQGGSNLVFIPIEEAQHNNISNYPEFGEMLDEVLQ